MSRGAALAGLIGLCASSACGADAVDDHDTVALVDATVGDVAVEFDGVATEVDVDVVDAVEVALEVDASAADAQEVEPGEVGEPMAYAAAIEVGWNPPIPLDPPVESLTSFIARPYTSQPDRYREAHAAGACTVWVFEPGFCDPACLGFDVCDAANRCVPFERALNVGTLTFTSGDAHTELAPESESDGSWYPGWMLPGQFGGGQPITITATGGPETAAFERTLASPPTPDFGALQSEYGSVHLPLSEGAAIPITWTPSGVSDLEVGLLLYSGHHGSPATRIIHCAAPDAAGMFTLEASVIAWFDPTHEGNNHPHALYRLARTFVASTDDALEVRTIVRRHVIPQ